MSTRGNIAIKENDVYTYIYNHHDSYLDGVGITLYKHYKDVEKVKQLIALGDLSSVGVTVEEGGSISYEDSLNKPLDERGTVAYFRDGNRWESSFSYEEWEDVKPFLTYNINDVLGNDFTYIFNVEENCWYAGYWKDNYKLYKLEELLHSKELLESVFNNYYRPEYMEKFYDACLQA